MALMQTVQRMIQFVFEGITELFAPNHDHYPATGVTPFSGVPYKKSHWHD